MILVNYVANTCLSSFEVLHHEFIFIFKKFPKEHLCYKELTFIELFYF